MKSHRFILTLLLTLAIIYFAQGSFYQQGSLLSQLSLFGILCISLIYFFKSIFLRNNKPLFFVIWTLLLIFNVLSFIFTADISNSLHFGKFKGLLIITLPFYSFYYLSYKGIINAKFLLWMFLAILPIAIMQFNYEKASILIERDWTDNVVNNLAYFFVYLIPYLFFFKKNKVFSVLAALVLMYFIIQGAKRGAIVTGFIGLIFYIFFLLKNVETKYKYRSYLITTVALTIMSYYAIDLVQNNEYLLLRMESIAEGGYSGRDTIYTNIFNGWYNSESILNIIFGFGFASALILSRTGHWAHNDWLEGLASMGLIGVVLYAFLIYSALNLYKNRKWGLDKKILLYTIITIWFTTTLFSMNYYNATHSFFQYIILGYLAGSKTINIE